MGEAKRRRGITDKSDFAFAAHQAIGHATAEATLGLLDRIHANLHQGAHGEASPIVQGAICGLLQFMVQSDLTDDEIVFAIDREVKRLLPQIRDAITNGEAQGSA
jgi:hypothetical protein